MFDLDSYLCGMFDGEGKRVADKMSIAKEEYDERKHLCETITRLKTA